MNQKIKHTTRNWPWPSLTDFPTTFSRFESIELGQQLLAGKVLLLSKSFETSFLNCKDDELSLKTLAEEKLARFWRLEDDVFFL